MSILSTHKVFTYPQSFPQAEYDIIKLPTSQRKEVIALFVGREYNSVLPFSMI